MLQQYELDLQHLKALSICHYVLGGLAACFGSFFVFYIVLGIMFLSNPGGMSGGSGPPPPAFMGYMFLMIGTGMVLLFWTFAAFVIISGRFLARRKHRLFCMIMSGISCAWAPLGTVLGVFTIIVLCRPSVKELFQAG